MTDAMLEGDRRNADVMATLMGQLAKDIGNVVAKQDAFGDKLDRANESLVRMEESNKTLATKEELLKVESSLREMVLPAQRDATAAHTRLDAHEIDFTEIERRFRSISDDHRVQHNELEADLTDLVGEVKAEFKEFEEKKFGPLATMVTELRLTWAKATGIAIGAGLLGGGTAGIVNKIAGG